MVLKMDCTHASDELYVGLIRLHTCVVEREMVKSRVATSSRFILAQENSLDLACNTLDSCTL